MPWQQQLAQQHHERKSKHLWRNRQTISSAQSRLVNVDGESYLNFCSNDYLGLASDVALQEQVRNAMVQRGFGAGASHLVCGHFDIHEELEIELAEFVGAEKAVLFSTGYMANLAIPNAFLGRQDLIVSDKLNHASLVDGAQTSPAKFKRYPHLDAATAATLIRKTGYQRKMLTTDGVFSMDGDTAPLKELHAVCESEDALLVVDDAHGFGVLGNSGWGLLESEGLVPSGNVLMVATFGKAVGSFGAFVAGDAVFIDHLIQHARPYIYTTALPPSVVAATQAGIQAIRNEPERRERLKSNIQRFRSGLADNPIEFMDSETAIQPLLIGEEEKAVKIENLLKEAGIWVKAIRPPTVPAGTARLRVTLTSSHTEQDIDHLVKTLNSKAVQQFFEAN